MSPQKSLTLILLLLTSGTTIANHNPQQRTAHDTIHCTIQNWPGGSIHLFKKHLFTNNEIPLASAGEGRSKGVFAIPFTNNTPQLIYLQCDKLIIPLYAIPQQNTHITLDINNAANSLKFTGPHSDINNYITIKERTEDHILSSDLKKLYSLPPADFAKLLDSTRSVLNTQLKMTVTGTDKISANFRAYEECDIISLIGIRALWYRDYHRHFTKESATLDSTAFSPFADTSWRPSRNGLQSDDYARLLSMLIRKKSDKVYIDTTLSLQQQQTLAYKNEYEIAKTYAADAKINEFLTTQILFMLLELGLDNGFNDILKDAQIYFKGREYLTYVLAEAEARKRIKPGNQAPNFEFANAEGHKVDLKSYQGKPLLIAVWTLGCQHSLDEIAQVNNIQKELPPNAVTILNLYEDANEQAGRDYFKSKSIGGTFGFAGPQSNFSKLYFVNSYPRFILIDAKGKIINAFTPRLTSPQLLPLLKNITIKTNATR